MEPLSTDCCTPATQLKRPIRRVLAPIREFIQTESSSGLVLLASTVAAMLWANLWPGSYTSTWETHAAIRLGTWTLDLSLRHWINDALMATFFLLVGLEIKRELLVGELSSPRKALLPVAAALGGMAVPALFFLAVAGGTDAARGWGIPMATDIAFALGILSLLGSRVPASLKIFLAALAIADDLGAVLVIALFYTETIQATALLAAAALFALLLASNWLGIRRVTWYCLLGVGLWLAVFYSGVHATVAGVLLAMALPAWSRLDLPCFRDQIDELAGHLHEHGGARESVLADEDLLARVRHLQHACSRLQPSLHRLEHMLAPWVAMVVMPVFALANAGVALSRLEPGLSDPLATGIAAGLVLGKPLGIVLGTWVVVRTGLAALPAGTTWIHFWGLGLLGGVGFTMSLFIAGLAIPDAARLDTARLAILAASTLAGVVGFLILRRLPRGLAED